MTKTRIALIVGAIAAASTFAFAETTAPAAASATSLTVNGTVIPAERFDALLKQALQAGQPDTPELRQKIRDHLVSLTVLTQEAVKQGLDKDPATQNELEMARNQILIRGLITGYVKAHPVTDDEVKALYDSKKAEMTSFEVKSRHILVKTEEEANKLLAQLKKGKKFEELAKKFSQDPGSKQNGGDLGWADPSGFVPEFANTLKSLAKGEITAKAVKSQFGYHIIQKEDQRETTPAFEELKPKLQRELENQKVEAFVKGLRDKAEVK